MKHIYFLLLILIASINLQVFGQCDFTANVSYSKPTTECSRENGEIDIDIDTEGTFSITYTVDGSTQTTPNQSIGTTTLKDLVLYDPNGLTSETPQINGATWWTAGNPNITVNQSPVIEIIVEQPPLDTSGTSMVVGNAKYDNGSEASFGLSGNPNDLFLEMRATAWASSNASIDIRLSTLDGKTFVYPIITNETFVSSEGVNSYPLSSFTLNNDGSTMLSANDIENLYGLSFMLEYFQENTEAQYSLEFVQITGGSVTEPSSNTTLLIKDIPSGTVSNIIINEDACSEPITGEFDLSSPCDTKEYLTIGTGYSEDLSKTEEENGGYWSGSPEVEVTRKVDGVYLLNNKTENSYQSSLISFDTINNNSFAYVLDLSDNADFTIETENNTGKSLQVELTIVDVYGNRIDTYSSASGWSNPWDHRIETSISTTTNTTFTETFTGGYYADYSNNRLNSDFDYSKVKQLIINIANNQTTGEPNYHPLAFSDAEVIIKSLTIGTGSLINLDTDEDGILNMSDLCPFTEPGASVDTSGCINTEEVVYIPDVNFKAALIANTLINTNDDSEIQISEATDFTGEIEVNNLAIKSLVGIEAFDNLTSLKCHENELTSLDLSQNINLITLKCNNNEIENLDLTSNTKLQSVIFHFNKITTLDISNQPNLLSLSCYSNRITSLDLSKNIDLQYLFCTDNRITTLNLINNTKLIALWFDKNNITSIDISNQPDLEILVSSENNLTNLDISNNTKIKTLSFDQNNITNIDITNQLNLETLVCSENNLTDLDITNNTKLNTVECQNNKFTTLNLSQNPLVEELLCDQNLNLYSICITMGQDTSLWIKDSQAVYSNDCSTEITIWDSNGWSNGPPESSSNVILREDFVVTKTNSLVAKNLTLLTGFTLTIKDASSNMEISEEVVNNGIVYQECVSSINVSTWTGNPIKPTPPVITSNSLAVFKENTPYSYTLTVSQLENPIWSIDSGSLFSGIELNGATIEGTPTQELIEGQHIKVSVGENECTASKTFPLSIKQLPSPLLVVSNPGQITYGDEPFTLTTNHYGNGTLKYEVLQSTCATVDSVSGEVTINCAGPQSAVTLQTTLSQTDLFRADTVETVFNINKKPVSFTVPKLGYILTDPDTSILVENDEGLKPTFIQFENEDNVATVTETGGLTLHNSGAFSVILFFDQPDKYEKYTEKIDFIVYDAPQEPKAVNDTINLFVNGDTIINILVNDSSVTGQIDPFKTDLDLETPGYQHIFYDPSLGEFKYHTNGELTILLNETFLGEDSISYTITNTDGQVSRIGQIRITAEPKDVILSLVSTELITPNGDGLNDVFIIGNNITGRSNILRIYNRLGEQVYTKENYEEDWGGEKDNGDELDDGVYYYIFTEIGRPSLQGNVEVRRR